MLKKALNLYLITCRSAGDDGGLLLAAAGEALARGATAIQLRGKELPDRQLYALGEALVELTRRHGALFLVNDRVDLCLALEADGVHLGQDDLPVPVARTLLPPERIIGLSVDNVAEALAGERAGADYLGAGPVYPTSTKLDAGAVMGTDGLARICAAVSCPVVAIGGLGPGLAAPALRAGAVGVTVASAVFGAASPGGAAGALRAELDQARAVIRR